MLKLKDGIVELYKKVATSLPSDIEATLKDILLNEKDVELKARIEGILTKIRDSRKNSTPICEDSGIPVFYVKVPIGLSYQIILETIVEATRIATEKIPLRPNAVDSFSGINSGDNTGSYFPLVYIEETKSNVFTIDLMLRCAKCEKLSIFYSLPTEVSMDKGSELANRDLDGIVKCLIDAVLKVKIDDCSPFIIGVAIGGLRDQVSFLSKRQLLRRLSVKATLDSIAKFEQNALRRINDIICKKKIRVIGVNIDFAHHHPDNYFVDISFACWANRKARLIW
ncbi:MAG: fumarate hydratase [Thermodesulfovibrionales bacterium]|nr:fumarate hydratase [Thermodesulfovibrionales bacterium]